MWEVLSNCRIKLNWNYILSISINFKNLTSYVIIQKYENVQKRDIWIALCQFLDKAGETTNVDGKVKTSRTGSSQVKIAPFMNFTWK